MLVVVDLGDFSMAKTPPINKQGAVIGILQNHYPDRLDQCIMLHAPVIFSVLFRVRSRTVQLPLPPPSPMRVSALYQLDCLLMTAWRIVSCCIQSATINQSP